MKAAVYARVSTVDQNTENQLIELRQYVAARKWTLTEYVDIGISGTKESRPRLDRLLKDARRRKFDALVVWRLDRLGRNLKHLLTVIDELQALGVPTEMSVLIAAVDVAAEDEYASGRSCWCSCPSS